jgi:hypothetical protein
MSADGGTVPRLPSGHPTPSPVPAVVSLDGWTLEPFTPDDAPLLAELLAHRGHRYVLDVPADANTIAALLAEVAKHAWSMSVALVRDGALGGFGTTALPNIRALNSSVTALFVDPQNATTPLAMYLRHLFWTFPLHRLHTQIPDLDLTREYIELLQRVGFTVEGRLVAHTQIAGQTFDAVALGLLRSDFETWCDEHEPRLSLR